MRRRTPVTTAIIALNLAAFLYELRVVGVDLLAGGGSLAALVSAGALVPVLVGQGEYWRLVTGAFLHGGALHIGVNMYSLYSIGRFVEVVAGPRRMATIYGISLVGSSLAVAVFGAPGDVTVGASGAIFGVFGALFAIGLKLGAPGMRLVRANLNVLLLNLVFTFVVPGISRWGHVGGLVVGFLTTLVIFRPPQPVPAGPE